MMTDDLSNGIVELLLDCGAQTYDELLKATKASPIDLDRTLAHLERVGAIYCANNRWFVSGRLIVRTEFIRTVSRGELPEVIDQFLRELHACGKMGVGYDDLLTMAKRRIGAS